MIVIPGLSPQGSGKPLLRRCCTQIIKGDTQGNGHKIRRASMPHREQMFANGAADGEKKILQGMVKPEIMCYNRSITRSGSLCSACGGAGGENKEACEG